MSAEKPTPERIVVDFPKTDHRALDHVRVDPLGAERRPDLVETAVLLPRRLRVGLQVDLKRHHAAKLRDEVRRSVHGGPYEIALKAALAVPPLLGPARGLAVLVDVVLMDEAHARGGRQAQAGGRCPQVSSDFLKPLTGGLAIVGCP